MSSTETFGFEAPRYDSNHKSRRHTGCALHIDNVHSISLFAAAAMLVGAGQMPVVLLVGSVNLRSSQPCPSRAA